MPLNLGLTGEPCDPVEATVTPMQIEQHARGEYVVATTFPDGAVILAGSFQGLEA